MYLYVYISIYLSRLADLGHDVEIGYIVPGAEQFSSISSNSRFFRGVHIYHPYHPSVPQVAVRFCCLFVRFNCCNRKIKYSMFTGRFVTPRNRIVQEACWKRQCRHLLSAERKIKQLSTEHTGEFGRLSPKRKQLNYFTITQVHNKLIPGICI